MESPYISGSIIESPVGLVLVRMGDRSNAMTVSCFSEAAHHPTTLWVSIQQATYTHSLLEKSGRFSLILLSNKQKDIAVACGSVSGRFRDKCADLNLYTTPSGFLFMKDVLASTACQVREAHSIGDHTLFLAEILEGEVDSRRSHLPHLLLSDL
jgi:flavin reductase (DIM6/NTAB) family NADH-FMN oxidoreductase RutF